MPVNYSGGCFCRGFSCGAILFFFKKVPVRKYENGLGFSVSFVVSDRATLYKRSGVSSVHYVSFVALLEVNVRMEVCGLGFSSEYEDCTWNQCEKRFPGRGHLSFT